MSVASDFVSLYVTVPDDGVSADRLAEALVEERLVACVNVLPGVTSYYRWDGELKRDGEQLLLCKTRRALVERATARVVALHPYELPCVLALPLVGGSDAYLAWIAEQTRAD